ncbi:MAG: hypothetical protein BGO69_02445 [Bacteroidetes bacterium 46-16]|nr:MAG: hypothetical protein BGO69_02445 [Bacteroidetes bacterium 46-16]
MNEATNSVREKKDNPSFGAEITRYIKHLDSLNGMVPLIMELILSKIQQEKKDIEKFIKDNNVKEEIVEDRKNLLIPEDAFKDFIELNENVEATKIANHFLPINFAVSFVSQYDAYLGRLIRTIFLAKPQILNSSERNILFSELLEFKDINEAKEFIIDKEVEAVLRDSHFKQFRWIENKVGIKLRENLPSFKKFIEITERRNLFVHCNGIVSRQYIDTCTEHEINGIEKIKVGDRLHVKASYLFGCYSILFEIGVKLGHVLWRKLLPEQIEDADEHLNNVCFMLLSKGKYNLALNLLTFATDILKKHCDQETEYIFTINKALAFHLKDKKEDCEKVISNKDWSAASDKFKLAISVLNSDYDLASNLMKMIGANHSHVTKDAYRQWPLFKKFRQSTEFKNAFKEVFEEEFIYVETKPKRLAEIIEEIRSMNVKGESEEPS